MKTNEAIHQIFEQEKNAYFQVKVVGNPFSSEEEYINVDKDEPKAAAGRVMKKFGEQDWVRLDFKGYISCYCPAGISQELRKVKESMFRSFAQYGTE